MITREELQDFLRNAENLITSLNIKELKDKQIALEEKTQSSDFWVNRDAVAMKELSKIEKDIQDAENFQSLIKDLKVAFDFNDEGEIEKIMSEIKSLEDRLNQKLFFKGEFDSLDAILSIHSGAGGIDAQDFAAMLMNMYQGLCKKNHWICNILSLSAGEEGGLKSASLEIKGEDAYGFLKEEVGTHRLVRLSPFNTGHTRETSFASVEVIPMGLEDGFNDIVIDDKDLKWDYFMSSGKGGQSVNTTYSAVRVTYLPENIVATCQNERSQQQNKEIAFKVLKSKVIHKKILEQHSLINDLKGVGKSADFGSQIRSYVMHPYKLVKDHRSKFESADVESVLSGEKVSDFIWAYKRFKQGKSVE